MKKLLLSLGSIAAAVAPITAIVACGDKNHDGSIATLTKISAATDGFVITEGSNKIFISKAEAAQAGEKNVLAGNIAISWNGALTAGTKVKIKTKNLQDAVPAWTAEKDATPAAVVVGTYNFDGLNLTFAELQAKINAGLIMMSGARVSYPFEFKDSTIASPVLTDASDAAFREYLKAAKLKLGSISFTRSSQSFEGHADIITFTPTIRITEIVETTNADITALKNAFATPATASAGVVAVAAKAEIKAAGATMTKAALMTAINNVVKGTGTGIAAISALTDALIKDDMKIELEIKTASTAQANGAATLTISGPTGTTSQTIDITITK